MGDVDGLGAVQQVGQVEVHDVVARQDVGVDRLDEVAEAHEQVLLPIEGEDLGAGDVVAGIQGPNRVDDVLLPALLFEVHGNLDDGALLGPGEALALGVEALNVEGQDAHGRDLDHLDAAHLLEVHVDLHLAGADAAVRRPDHEPLRRDPAPANEMLVDHEAQREGDVGLVGRRRLEDPLASWEGEAGLDDAPARGDEARHRDHDPEEGRVVRRPLPSHQRGARHDLDREDVGVHLVPTAGLRQLLLQCLPEELRILPQLLRGALHEEVGQEAVHVRQDAVALLRDAVDP
mmetsp:Transcript_136285/g.423494  ORF Transcript_136285/g.423494 Transcript_136285/m.423494 type:complete len:290 (+) Transcript_136285:2280-3149(+)